MTRQEKREQTFQLIVDSAMEMFGEKGYENTSISDIAKLAIVSKGISYHYFKGKDEMYLYCIEVIIKEISEYFQSNINNDIGIEKGMELFVMLGAKFVQKNPKYKMLLFNIASDRPSHLKDEIIARKKTFFDSNIKLYDQMLSKITLGKGVTKEFAIKGFSVLQYSLPTLIEIHGESEMNEFMIELIRTYIKGLQVDK